MRRFQSSLKRKLSRFPLSMTRFWSELSYNAKVTFERR
nr:MAG TPA: hypothetical protein [Caudoviricetes sp.]